MMRFRMKNQPKPQWEIYGLYAFIGFAVGICVGSLALRSHYQSQVDFMINKFIDEYVCECDPLETDWIDGYAEQSPENATANES